MANDTYLSYNVMLMKIAGIISIESESRIKIWLFRCWRLVQNLTLSHLIVGAYVSLRQSKEFVTRVQSVMYLGIGACYLWRMNYFIISEKKFLNLLSEMQVLFKWKTSTGLEEKCLEDDVKLVRRLALFSIVVLTITGQSTILLPSLLNKTSERIFPLPMWFPDSWKASPYYELALFYQVYVLEIFVAIVVGIDILFASAVILTCSQFEMLSWECKCLLHKASSKLETNYGKQLNDSSRTLTPVNQEYHPEDPLISRQIEGDLLRDLSKLIVFHQSLINFCYHFDALFSPMLVWYILIVSAIAVFDLFIITMTSDLIILAIFVTYVMICATFVFLPCYFGHLLTTQSEKFFEDLYDSRWYMCSENFKTTFKLLHFRARKPIFLTIGKFGSLSLNVFLWCVKTVASYVIVLHQISRQN